MTVSTDGWWPFVDPVEMNFAQICMNCLILGYILFQASNLISDGSELLMLVPSLSSVVGSIVLPVLGAVPDGCMVAFSGNSQKEVAVGIGTLAGSTIMLLTLPWFIAVLFGRVNIKDGAPTYKRPADAAEDWDKSGGPHSDFGMWTTGVAVTQELRDNAKIMVMSTFGYLVIQIPATLVSNFDEKDKVPYERVFSFIALLVCLAELAYYMKMQWSQDDNTALEDAVAEMHVKAIKNHTLTLRGAMVRFHKEQMSGLLTDKGGLREELVSDKEHLARVRWLCKILAPFFAYYDLNGDNQIDFNEFRLLFKDIRAKASKSVQKELFDIADTHHMGSICFEEFAACIMAYAMEPIAEEEQDLVKKRGSADTQENPFRKDSMELEAPRVVVENSESEQEEKDGDGDDEDDEEEEEEDMPEDLEHLDPAEQQRRILMRAFTKMGLGSIVLLVFSDPMVDVMSEMGDRLGISAFYVAFVVAPMVSNAAEMIAAHNYARKRTVKSISTALSTLEGAGVMNNTFVLGVFMALICFKGLHWEFTAETISVLAVEFVIGFMVMYRRIQTLFDGCIVLSFYPISLSVVAFLENVMGIN